MIYKKSSHGLFHILKSLGIVNLLILYDRLRMTYCMWLSL